MTKVRFVEEQSPVKIVTLEEVDYIYICLNGVKKTEQVETNSLMGDSEAKTVTYWEYDYNEIIEKSGVLNLSDIKATPTKYLDYDSTKVPEKTNDEKLAYLMSENELLRGCIMELADIVFA